VHNELLEEIRLLGRRFDSSIGALGARWGLLSERSFRNGLKGILEEDFGVEVINVLEYDDEGFVFGGPEQVELDIIIKNGVLIACELKSNMDKGAMYLFDRVVHYYEKRHQKQATKKIVISPMVDARARAVAERLGIAVYTHHPCRRCGVPVTFLRSPGRISHILLRPLSSLRPDRTCFPPALRSAMPGNHPRNPVWIEDFDRVGTAHQKDSVPPVVELGRKVGQCLFSCSSERVQKAGAP